MASELEAEANVELKTDKKRAWRATCPVIGRWVGGVRFLIGRRILRVLAPHMTTSGTEASALRIATLVVWVELLTTSSKILLGKVGQEGHVLRTLLIGVEFLGDSSA